MSDLRFQPATLEDGATLARLMLAAWPEDRPDLARISTVLHEGDHTTLLARLGNQVVGFVDCFSTASLGVATYEIDLLAVAPAARGRGVASALMAEVTRLATEAGYRAARALVAVGNAPMQAVMRRVGYLPSAVAHALMINSAPLAQEGVNVSFDAVHILPVSTLTYRGGWLSPPFTTATLAGAVTLREQVGLVGAVIPYDEIGQIETAKALGYQHIGDYEWWEKQSG